MITTMNANIYEFNRIYEEYHAKLFRYLARFVGEDDAEDLTQEVFVKIHKALDNFRGESKLSTWIYRIATNTATDRLRSPSLNCSRTLPADTAMTMASTAPISSTVIPALSKGSR